MILVFVALLMVLHRVLLFRVARGMLLPVRSLLVGWVALRVARWVVLPVAMLSAWWA